MSETNETSNLATLADSELDAVAGGVFDFGNLVSQANNATAVGGGARLQDRRMCGWVVRGCRSGGETQTEGIQMRTGTWIGLAGVVAIGVMWSIAAMSSWVPVNSAELRLAVISSPAITVGESASAK
jgi:hypothetical protein